MLVSKARGYEIEFLEREIKRMEINVEDYGAALGNARAVGDREQTLKMRTLMYAQAGLLWEAQDKLKSLIAEANSKASVR